MRRASPRCFSFFVSIASFLFLPFPCLAFTVSPAVVDVPFVAQERVVQVFSIVNTTERVQTYVVEIQEVFFAQDGNVSSFADSDPRLGAFVDVPRLSLAPGAEGMITVTFSFPEMVSPSDVFGLVLTEQEGDAQDLSSGFVALLFPTGITSDVPAFRIDAFTVVEDGHDLRVVGQFTNTGTILARPASFVVVHDRFAHEISRFVFAEHEGRLPVGTTRVFSEALPFSFGFFHLGGDVTFTLWSFAEGSDDVQRASVVLATRPGLGIFFIAGGFVFLLFVAIIFFYRRGILRS